MREADASFQILVFALVCGVLTSRSSYMIYDYVYRIPTGTGIIKRALCIQYITGRPKSKNKKTHTHTPTPTHGAFPFSEQPGPNPNMHLATN